MHWNNCWSNSYKNVDKFFLNKSYLIEDLFIRFFYESTFKFFFFKVIKNKKKDEEEDEEDNEKEDNEKEDNEKEDNEKEDKNKDKKESENKDEIENSIVIKKFTRIKRVKVVKEVKSVKKIKEVKSIEEEIQELRDKRKERAKLLPIMHKQLGVPEFFDALRFDYSKFDEERVKVFKENNNKAKIIFALSIIKAKIAAKARAKVTCTLRPDRKKGKRIRRVKANYNFSKIWFIKFNGFILINFFVYYYSKIRKKKKKRKMKIIPWSNPMAHTFFKKKFGKNLKRDAFLTTVKDHHFVF